MEYFSKSEESELTSFTMAVSEPGLSKCWDQEDDEYWEFFLNKTDQGDYATSSSFISSMILSISSPNS